jgi:hypothetical protein
VAEHWPEIDAWADQEGLDPYTLAAVLVLETGLRPVEGQRSDVTGVGQVSVPTWRPLLEGEGLHGADLLEVEPGIRAAALVLGYLRARVGRHWLCQYAAGHRGRAGCRYERMVAALAAEIRRGR